MDRAATRARDRVDVVFVDLLVGIGTAQVAELVFEQLPAARHGDMPQHLAHRFQILFRLAAVFLFELLRRPSLQPR